MNVEKSVNSLHSLRLTCQYSHTHIFRTWRTLRKPEPRLLVFCKLKVTSYIFNHCFSISTCPHPHKPPNSQVQQEQSNLGTCLFGTQSHHEIKGASLLVFSCSLQVELWYSLNNWKEFWGGYVVRKYYRLVYKLLNLKSKAGSK